MSSVLSFCCFGSSSAVSHHRNSVHSDNRLSHIDSKRYSRDVGQMSECFRSDLSIARLPTTADLEQVESVRKARTSTLSRYDLNPTLRHSFRRPSFVGDSDSDTASLSTVRSEEGARRPSFVPSESDSYGSAKKKESSDDSERPSYAIKSPSAPSQPRRHSTANSTNRRFSLYRPSTTTPSATLKRNSMFSILPPKNSSSQVPAADPDPRLKRLSAHGADIEKLFREEQERYIKSASDPEERKRAVERERRRRAQWSLARGCELGR